MTTPLGRRISTIFVDEFHELYAHHPGRKKVWDSACLAISILRKQCVFTSATHPPRLDDVFYRMAHTVRTDQLPNGTRVIRASTDRPELAYYILNLPHSSLTSPDKNALWLSAILLVNHLRERLEIDERILVFFASRGEADALSSNIFGCTVYHAHLSPNQKADNLGLWDSGKSPVMAATTAAGQGIDRPYIKFVIIYGHTYGMGPYVQQGGRGGRGGRPSYVISLRDPRVSQSPPFRKEDVNCAGPFCDYTTNENVCRRRMLLDVMDGEGESAGCLDKPGCNRCDICDPNSYMLKTIRAAAFPETASHPSAPSSDTISHSSEGYPLEHTTPPTMVKVGESGRPFEKVRVS
jgi:superfamily II DNA helicase RecQ